ncbi:MAG: class I SAM-dependent methyltransferase [candidate division KSB1 bacterium]|nr:class I SAM-dependent methyltransferase [candidate division KSB1 bacterium]MDZ7342466.1 class I SAM-dependent methyltransferase [candidate division KSB1 bacterium]
MADLSDWRHLLPRQCEHCLIINLPLDDVQGLVTDLSSCDRLWLDEAGQYPSSNRSAEKAAVTRIELPFTDEQFDGVIAQFTWRTGFQLLSEIHRVLRPGGTAFCHVKQAWLMGPLVQRWMNSLHFEYRCFFAMPSVENPWYILPADDHAVSGYFFVNILASRHRKRRLLIKLGRQMAKYVSQGLLLKCISHHVVIGRKSAAK